MDALTREHVRREIDSRIRARWRSGSTTDLEARIVALLDGEWQTARQLGERCGVSGAVAGRLLRSALERGEIERDERRSGGGGRAARYRRAG